MKNCREKGLNCSVCRGCDIMKKAVYGADPKRPKKETWQQMVWQKEIHISEKNEKLGHIVNLSLAPVLSCPKDAPCTSCEGKTQCYALKSFYQYKQCYQAWGDNYLFATTDSEGFFQEISNYFKNRYIPFFRWHTAGDILDQNYLEGMKKIARENKQTKFLAFTKMRDLDYSDLPKNLVVVASQWEGFEWGDNLPKAVVRAKGETWKIKGAIECPGYCETCRKCWKLKPGKAVIFNAH